MMAIEKILANYDFKKRSEKSITSIEEIENKINFKLPEDYKFYLQNYLPNEAFIGSVYLRLWELDRLAEMNTDYEIFDNLPNTIAIGTNGGGEFLAIECTKQNNYRVVISPLIDLDKQYHVEIGNSFTDFFERLEKGYEWFH